MFSVVMCLHAFLCFNSLEKVMEFFCGCSTCSQLPQVYNATVPFDVLEHRNSFKNLYGYGESALINLDVGIWWRCVYLQILNQSDNALKKSPTW